MWGGEGLEAQIYYPGVEAFRPLYLQLAWTHKHTLAHTESGDDPTVESELWIPLIKNVFSKDH